HEGLSDRTEPEELAGIDPSEVARIVNFRLPGTVPAFNPTRSRLAGTVEEGGRPVAHAEVRLVDDTGRILRQGFTDDAGSFQLVSVVPGSYHVVAFLPDGNRP